MDNATEAQAGEPVDRRSVQMATDGSTTGRGSILSHSCVSQTSRCGTEDLILTAEAFDDILEDELETLLRKSGATEESETAKASTNHIRRTVSSLSATIDMLKGIETLRNMLSSSVSNQEQAGRGRLMEVFGGDCARISRTRAVLEAVISSDGPAADDDRVTQCRKACESVEKVLEDLGLGVQLRKAKEHEMERLIRRGESQARAELESPVIQEATSPEMAAVQCKDNIASPAGLADLPSLFMSEGRNQQTEEPPDQADLDTSSQLPAHLEATIIDRETKDFTTWYKIRLFDGEEESYYSKRFSDFIKLDEDLRISGVSVIALPTPGLVGARHRLDLGSFNEDRQQGLQCYLHDVLGQCLSDNEALANFFAWANARRSVRLPRRSHILYSQSSDGPDGCPCTDPDV